MTMAIVFTIVAILAITFIGALFGAASGEGWEFAGIAFEISFKMSCVIWIVYIFIHFAIKYW